METLKPNSAPSGSTIPEEIFDVSSLLKETLGGSSPSSPSETLDDHSLVPIPSIQNGSSQSDQSMAVPPSNSTGSSSILPPINETLNGSSSSSSLVMETETLDDCPSFPPWCDGEEDVLEEEEELLPSSPNRLLGNNLWDYSSSRWSSSHSSSSWSSWPSSRGTSSSSSSWSTWPSSEETRSSLPISNSALEFKPSTVVCYSMSVKICVFVRLFLGIIVYVEVRPRSFNFAGSRRGDWYAVLFLIFCFVLERLILRLEPRTCCF